MDPGELKSFWATLPASERTRLLVAFDQGLFAPVVQDRKRMAAEKAMAATVAVSVAPVVPEDHPVPVAPPRANQDEMTRLLQETVEAKNGPRLSFSPKVRRRT